MTEHAVVIAGAGPTGLMLAGELALAGVDVAIVERRPTQDVMGRRAGGLLARSIEVLEQRGIAQRFIAQGQKHAVSMFSGARFIADLPTRHNYVLGLPQQPIERILAEWVGELGVPILRSREVTGFAQDASGVDIVFGDGESIRARYLVGCDGGRSVIRKTAGIDFPGWDAATSWLIAEFEYAAEPKWGFTEDALGKHAIAKVEGGLASAVLVEPQVSAEGEPTLQHLRDALSAVYGTDYGIHSPRFVSRFTDAARQAASYRDRRVLLAGDAAHVHSPVGGQGLNTGLQDAVNLGWKLAQVVKGVSPDALLDSYHAERHPVAARVLRTNIAQVRLGRPDERTKALRETLQEVLELEESSRRLTAQMTGLDIHYNLGEGHPLLGRRMPDLDIRMHDGERRVFELLHKARPVLLTFGGRLRGVDLKPWVDRVQFIDARYEGKWELPLIGAANPPTGVLIRPDGHVAWVGEGTEAGLVDALTRWFGTG